MDMRVSIVMGVPPKCWMVYSGKSQSKIDDLGVPPMSRNLHMAHELFASWVPFSPKRPRPHARGAPAEKDPGHEHDMIYLDLLDLGGDGGPNRGIDGKPLPF